jgi:hypothetical protein
MERFFMPRKRALALIVAARRELLAKIAEQFPGAGQPLNDEAAQLERLMLDVRAGRIDEFELHKPTPIHVIVSDN